jgi:hypothetical protein
MLENRLPTHLLRQKSLLVHREFEREPPKGIEENGRINIEGRGFGNQVVPKPLLDGLSLCRGGRAYCSEKGKIHSRGRGTWPVKGPRLSGRPHGRPAGPRKCSPGRNRTGSTSPRCNNHVADGIPRRTLENSHRDLRWRGHTDRPLGQEPSPPT